MSLGIPPKREGEEALACLLRATQVAGFRVGFIGNEAFYTDQVTPRYSLTSRMHNES